MIASWVFAWLAGYRRIARAQAICCLVLTFMGAGACAGSDPGGPSGPLLSEGGSTAAGTSTTAGLGGSGPGTTATTQQGASTVAGSDSTTSTSLGGASASTTQGTVGSGGDPEVGGTASTTGSLGSDTTAGMGGASTSGGTTGGVTSGGAAVGGAGGAMATSGSGGTTTDGTTTGGTGQGGSGGTDAGFEVCSTAPPAGTRVVTIHVIGDSTASIYASDLYPRTGWGQVLGDYYAPACAVVSDKALSGRSSKSFYDEGAWTPVRDALVAGDFVLIQFGHNDEKSDDPTRYTDPQTTFKEYLTTYIEDTRARNATPVLATPINRNNWNGTTLKDTHGDYPPAMRELAADLGVALIDLTALTKAYFERIGPDAATVLFMNLDAGEFPNYPDGNSDNTHLRETGARVVAELLNYDAYQQQLPLATLLADVPTAP